MSNKKSNAGIVVFIGILICLFIGFNIAKSNFEKSPEYAIYQTVTGFRDGDYQKIAPYVDFDTLADNLTEKMKNEFLNLPEVKAYPYQRAVSIMFDRIMDEKKSTFKEDMKKGVESKKYVQKGMESVPDAAILASLIIKKYDRYEIIAKKDITTSNIKFNKDGKTKVEFDLKKNKGNWKITNIDGDDLKLIPVDYNKKFH